ncbi:major facilitator superfamily transporter [Ligilactobacillus agilis]|uniref:Major facilitator superfamily transporter n=1 Tax=Ligilactobacillus agilis TaxID=1601 RepID=A0A6F9XR65_9LACO|nr:MFS transporter [Ligilactobacillus agilis]GET07732.1 major facilitator superfamily transporter [Ligilactobacillus agilis]
MAPTISDKDSKLQILKDFLSNLISTLCSSMFAYGLGFMLLDTTHSAISFGLNMLITPLVSILFVIPVGNLVDRYSHKKIIVISLLARVLAALGLYFFLSLSNFYHLVTIIIFLFINALALNFSTTSYSAAVHELVNLNYLQKLSSFTQVASASASIAAPMLGVLLYSLVDFNTFILLEVGAHLLTLTIVLSMKFHSTKRETATSTLTFHNQWQDFVTGLNYLKSQTILSYIILLAVILNFFYASLNIGLPFIVKQELHLANKVVGTLETSLAIGMLCGSLIMVLFSKKQAQIFKWWLIIPLLCYDFQIILLGCLFLTSPTQTTLILIAASILLVLAICLMILNIKVQVYLQLTVASQLLGRVMAVLNTCATSSLPLGVLVFTFLFQHFSNGGGLFLISGLILLTCSLAIIPKIKEI